MGRGDRLQGHGIGANVGRRCRWFGPVPLDHRFGLGEFLVGCIDEVKWA